MLNKGPFRIEETARFRKQVSKTPGLSRIYEKIHNFVYPLLRKNPYYGPNIKRLKGEFSDFYRCRIGDYRLFYTIDGNKVAVVIVRIAHRQSAYD